MGMEILELFAFDNWLYYLSIRHNVNCRINKKQLGYKQKPHNWFVRKLELILNAKYLL